MCDEHLIAASGLIAHIKSNRLKKVKNDNYASRCKKKLVFTKGRVRREYEKPDMPEHLSVVNLKLAENAATKNGQYNFTQDISRAKKLSAGSSSVSSHHRNIEIGVRTKLATLSEEKETNLPQLAAKESDVSTSGLGGKVEKLPVSAWSQGKKLFDNGPAPVRPPPVGRRAVHQQVEIKKPDWSVHDPRSPGWDPKNYYIAYLDKYKCPYDRCP